LVNYREILRLNSQGYSQRQITTSVQNARDTVSEVIRRANTYNVSWPLDPPITDRALKLILYPERINKSDKKEPDYQYIHNELAKDGVTLTLLWSEYCEACRAANVVPYMSTQFCDKYRRWAKSTKATMRIKHKPGNSIMVDWAGNTLDIHDSVTGDIIPAYMFVSVLPCSCYAYVEPCLDMKSESWIVCHVNMYGYFGGSTRLIIPDNLRTGVVSNTRYETILNRSYNEMAEYYDTAVVPARVDRPRDKSAAEGTVKYTSTWIIAALRNRKYFNIHELKSAVAEKLEEFNTKNFAQREGSRLSAFLNEEKPFLKPLPASPYEPAVWSTATVQKDYLISDEKNKFSVPFDLIGERIDVRITRNTIEAFYHGSRVASHPRPDQRLRDPIVNPDHMPENHRKYLSYNDDEFLTWAAGIGTHTHAVVKSFLESGKASEQGYKACASLTKLADRYGHDKVESACERTLVYMSQPNIRNISVILRNRQETIGRKPETRKADTSSQYGITRGADYFSRGGGGGND